MTEKSVNLLKEMDFHKYNAKSTGESLFIHSFNVYSLVKQVTQYIPNLTDRDLIKLKIAALLHDFGKTYDEYQSKLSGPHKLKDGDIRKIKELISKIETLTDNELDDIIYMIQNHHSIDMEKVNTNRDRLTRILVSGKMFEA
jgi:HD-GYP domain-containing protein (c-di-GMP phosphodiesterase class II)